VTSADQLAETVRHPFHLRFKSLHLDLSIGYFSDKSAVIEGLRRISILLQVSYVAFIPSYFVKEVKQSLLQHKEIESGSFNMMLLCELSLSFIFRI
jgi:hypothetical protein